MPSERNIDKITTKKCLIKVVCSIYDLENGLKVFFSPALPSFDKQYLRASPAVYRIRSFFFFFSSRPFLSFAYAYSLIKGSRKKKFFSLWPGH